MPGSFTSVEAMLEDIRNCAKEAITNTYNQSKSIIQTEIDKFYVSGEPKVYRRTGTLGESGRVGDYHSGGDVTSFEAYLEDKGGHPKPRQLVTVGDVINATLYERSRWHIVGNYDYWTGSTQKIGEKQSSELSKYFVRG